MKKQSFEGEEGFGHQENQEPQETFERVALEVKEPDGMKNWRIEYQSDSLGTCAAYDAAIEEITKREKLHPFHQSGEPHTSGWHQWEFWADTDREAIEALLEEIHAQARDKFEVHKQLGLHEFWRSKADKRQ